MQLLNIDQYYYFQNEVLMVFIHIITIIVFLNYFLKLKGINEKFENTNVFFKQSTKLSGVFYVN